MNIIKAKVSADPINWKILVVFFLFTGCSIRLFHFFSNRSLWLDEVYLASSFLHLNFKQLINGPLDYQQKAPVGFLLVVKLCCNLFGNKEIGLRLPSLISGLLTLFLMVPVSRYFLKPAGSLLVIGIICLSPAFIYHSVEMKQYSTELLATVLSFYLFIRYRTDERPGPLIMWGIFGGILLWFSYAAIFILAGMALALSINHVRKGEWRILFLRLIPFTMWLVSFGINYFLFTHKHAEAKWVVYWFRFYDNFMPFPPHSISDLKWFAVTFYRMIDYPLGLLWNFNNVENQPGWSVILKMAIIPLGLFLLGTYKTIQKNKLNASILLLPVGLTLLASGLEFYPLTERFWLFIAPVFLLIIGEGFDLVWSRLKNGLLACLFFLFTMTGPISQALGSLIHPEKFYTHKKSYISETLDEINTDYQKGDAVYIYWNILPQFRVYSKLKFYKFIAVEGKDFRGVSTDLADYQWNLRKDFDQLKGKKRVWLVFSHKFLANIGDRINEPQWYYQMDGNPTDIVVKELLKLGELKKKEVTTDVTICLFTLK